MDKALQALLENYTLQTSDDYEHALKEIIQHLALLGLWRSKFYEHAAFYGGTALRIFYNLRRFSEDLDFSLLHTNENFNLYPHLKSIKNELTAFGFKLEIEKKDKSIESQIESAFLKGNTKGNLIYIKAPEAITASLPENKQLKIKIELDIDPPMDAHFEVKTLLVPIPFQVRLFKKEDLFAGKLHAILCRKWKNRVKGRDFYDFIWYISQHIPCNLSHLKARMVQTGHFKKDDELNKKTLIDLLHKRFHEVDFSQAKADVSPFITDHDELALWDRDFFLGLLDLVEVVV